MPQTFVTFIYKFQIFEAWPF